MTRAASLGLLLGFIGVVLFGATVPATRYGVHWLDPLFFTLARASVAGILAALVLVVRRSTPPWRRGAPLGDFLIITATLVFGFPLMMALGSVTVPSSHAGVVLGIMPLATTVAAMLLAGERPSVGFLLLSVLGCALVAAFALRNGAAGGFGIGDLILAAGALMAAVGYAVSGRLARRVAGWEVICWSLAISLPVALACTVWFAPPDLGAVPASAWVALGYVGAISQMFAFFFWNAGLAMGGIARVGQLQLLQTFLSVVLSWPINGEAPDAETYAFMAAVMVVVALGQRMRVRVVEAAGSGRAP